MADNSIRIGYVSSVDYENGTIKVTYPDRDDAVTDDLPVLTFGGKYFMPKIDDAVLVVHLSNGSSMGIVCGPYWCEGNMPPESGQGLFRQELSANTGEAYIRCQDGHVIIHGKSVKIEETG